jgi:hypothetical protein
VTDENVVKFHAEKVAVFLRNSGSTKGINCPAGRLIKI